MSTIPTTTTARKAYERAQDTNECADWQTAAEVLWALANKPKKRRRGRKLVYPAMLTTFADGRTCRMGIAQREGDPLPAERASSIARAIYRAHVASDVPEVVSCECVNGQPIPEGCGLVRYKPSNGTLATLRLWEAGDWRPAAETGIDFADASYDPWRDQSAPRYRQAA